MKNKLKEKTLRVNELKESLQINIQDEDIPELSDTDDNIIVSPEIAQSINPMHEKVQDRIRLLKLRCENGLGNIIFEKAYNYVCLNNKTLKPN